MNWLQQSLVWPKGAVLSFADERITNPPRALLDYTSANNPLRHLHISPSALAALWPYAVLLIALIVIAVLVTARHFIAGLLVKDQDTNLTFLELASPADSSKAAFATQQLYALLHAPALWSPWRLLRPARVRYSLELYATKTAGIRYVLVVPSDEAPGLRLSLMSYLPGLRVTEARDYLGEAASQLQITSLTLSSDPALPLKSQGDQSAHDPISYIAGQMASLGPSELIAYQLVITPITRDTHPTVWRKFARLRDHIARGLPLTPVLDTGPQYLPASLKLVVTAIERMLTLTLHVAALMLRGTPSPAEPAVAPAGEISKYEQSLSDLVLSKLDQPLFEVSLRLLATQTTETTPSRLNQLTSSFRLFTSPYQSLVSTTRSSHQALARRRLPTGASHAVLGAAELADLYHFPNTALTISPGLSGSRSPELPMPTSFRNAISPTDSLFGRSHFGEQTADIRLPGHQRLRHTYIFGRTGTGKTTLLTRAIFDDIAAGRGVAVLDPHGDMLNYLLGVIPETRRKDVVVFDPSEREWPIGINLLNPGIKFKDDIERRDRITSAVLSVFAKLSDEKYWGPRMEHILRNATLTTLHTKDPTLYTLQRLLTDRDYQKQVSATLEDPVLKQFWDKELSKAGDFQLTSFTAPLTNRLGQFITTGMSRHILLQKHSTISIANIMDQGKILLVNLSKGELGEDQSTFFGTIMTALIWMAAYSRTHQPEPDRRGFYVYVDEFQNFATRHFAEIASEGRKFHIALTLSHQSVAQITDQRILKIIAGNAGTVISFAGSPDDESFIQPFMHPVVRSGDITNLPAHHFFIKTKDIPDADAFSGTTAPLEDLPATYQDEQATAMRTRSKLTHGVHIGLLNHYFKSLFATAAKEPRVDQPFHVVRPKPMRKALSESAKAAPRTQKQQFAERLETVQPATRKNTQS